MRWPNEKTRTKQRKNNDLQEKCEDTNGVIRGRKSKKDRQHNGQKTQEQNKGQTMIYKKSVKISKG